MRLRTLLVAGVSICSPLAVASCGSSTDTTPAKKGGSSTSDTATSSTTGSGGSEATSTTATTGATGGGGSGGAGGDNGMPSDIYPAFHPVPPTETSYGGPTLKTPKVYPIYFSNDDMAFTAQLTDFYSKLGATQYWLAISKEYNVGALTSETPISLPETATGTIDDTAIQMWLAAKLNADDPMFPTADQNTVFAINYPTGLTITQQGSQSCADFGGYHNSVALDAAHGAMNVAYAVIPRCNNFDGFTGVDAITGAASHELIEAATDPYPGADPANASVDSAHSYWVRALGGGEVGDLCAQQLSSFTKFAELDYLVQRSWSNKSAKTLHDPCVPALPGLSYFNSAPVLPDTVMVMLGPQTVAAQAVTIGLNETKDVEIDLFSDGPTNGPWFVEATDLSAATGKPASLKLALDSKKGMNGQKLHLSVTVLVEGKHKTETFFLTSSLGKQQAVWVGLVANP